MMANLSDIPQGSLARRWVNLKTGLAAALLAELLACCLLRGGSWRQLGLGWQFWLLVGTVSAAITLSAKSSVWFVRRRLQFGLRTLLTLVLCVGLSLGTVGMHWQRTEKQRSAASALEEMGARVSYAGGEQPGLLTFVGRKYFQEPTALGYSGPLRAKDLVNIEALSGLEFLDLANSQISDADLAHLASLHKVRNLGLIRTRITGRGLQQLKMNGLWNLDLCWSPVDDDGLRSLSQLRTLNVLCLNHTRITDAGLVHLASLEQLFALYLDGTTVTGEGFVHLRQLPYLEAISLDRSWLTNSGLAALGDLPTLTQLNVSNTVIDDEVMDTLCGMSRLKSLRLHGTGISDDGILRLQREMRDCQVLH